MCFVKEARGSFFMVQAPGVAPLSAHLLMAVPAIVLFASLGAPVFCKLQYAKPRKRGSVPIKAPQSCHFLEIFKGECFHVAQAPKQRSTKRQDSVGLQGVASDTFLDRLPLIEAGSFVVGR
jgi:hypothetical protein